LRFEIPSRKAGRYKLAAPVLKTGSARAEVGALPTPSARFRRLGNHWQRLPCRGATTTSHIAIQASSFDAASQFPAVSQFTCRARRKECFSRTTRHLVAYKSGHHPISQFNPQRKENHETHTSFPKPVALPQELQTQSSHPHQTGQGELHLSARALRSETENQIRPVAQEQSIRPITGRPRSITARDDQPSLFELRLGTPDQTQAVQAWQHRHPLAVCEHPPSS